tara:strand:+ start:2723 stop:4471 length:1749 start_codon:yes stop_codon:yes gene_type:complete
MNFKKIYKILTIRKTNSKTLLCLLSILNSTLEFLTIGSIIPIFYYLSGEKIENNFFLEKYFSFLNTINLNFTDKTKEILLIISIFFLCFILRSIVYLFYFYKLGDFKKRLSTDLSTYLFKGYLQMPYIHFSNYNSSDFLRNSTIEVKNFVELVGSLFHFFTDFLVILTMLLLISIIGIELNIFFAGIILLTFGYLFIILTKKKMIKISNERLIYDSKIFKNLIESFSAIKEIKLSHSLNYFSQKFSKGYDYLQKIQLINNILLLLPRIWLELFSLLFIFSFLFFKLIVNNEDFLNSISLIVILTVALIKIIPSMQKIIQSFQRYSFVKPSIEKIFSDHIFIEKNRNEIIPKGPNIEFIKNIKISNLSFSYDDRNIDIFKEVEFEIKKKDIIGFTGISGVGKSTMVNLLSGILTPIKGSILIDENNYLTNLESWQKKISYVTQNPIILDDTIKRNIAFGQDDEKISDKKILNVLELANLKDTISQLKNGINTIVGENGLKFSGGQIQRISIARALYANKEILILDEATNALDEETENNILNEIKALNEKKNITVLIISHKKNVLKICNKIIQVKNKKLVNINE